MLKIQYDLRLYLFRNMCFSEKDIWGMLFVPFVAAFVLNMERINLNLKDGFARNVQVFSLLKLTVLQIFLKWLFGKQAQKEMPGESRTFRRKNNRFGIYGHYHQRLNHIKMLHMWTEYILAEKRVY